MATSPIYSWPEPDNTDLVKNGALAIRTLGDAIDTTMATMVAKTIVDAKGDIIAATAADTVSKLTVGANNTVLTADSSTATGLKWATPSSGGETLISTTTLSGASVVLSSVPTTYNSLKINITGATNSTADGKLRILGVSQNVYMTGLESGTAVTVANGYLESNSNYLRTSDSNGCSLIIENYTVADSRSQAMVWSGAFLATASANKSFIYGGSAGSTSGWTTITIQNTGGNWAGGTVKLYGVK